MEKIGRVRLPKLMEGSLQPQCASCGRRGAYRVTFQDYWGKLVVKLCEECAGKKYEELRLQTRIDWPGVA